MRFETLDPLVQEYLGKMQATPVALPVDVPDALIRQCTNDVRDHHGQEALTEEQIVSRGTARAIYLDQCLPRVQSEIGTGTDAASAPHIIDVKNHLRSLDDAVKDWRKDISIEAAIDDHAQSLDKVGELLAPLASLGEKLASTVQAIGEKVCNTVETGVNDMANLRRSQFDRGMKIATILWFLLLLAILSGHLHAQTFVKPAPPFGDYVNSAFRVNVVAGGAGGGLAQLQVGRVSDGAFINVGYFAGQLNVPVNCVVGCSGGASTPSDTFTNPTTASLNMAFPMVWNGATWDRLYGDKTNGAFVNVKVLPSITIANTAFQANAGTNLNTSLLALESGGNLATLAGAVSSSKFNINISSGSIGNTSFASTVADGANVTLGAKTDAKSTATDTTAITVMSVLKEISAMEQAPASRAVTNVGTFATQSAVTAASGAFASGAIASGAIASGAVASGAIVDGAIVTLGAKTDAADTHTDGTSISIMQVLKELSAKAQAPASTPVTFTMPALVAGSAIIGKVTTDQTTHGTTDLVAADVTKIGGTAVVANPCQQLAPTAIAVNQAAAGPTTIISGVSAKHVYICSITLISATAQNVNVVAGTGTNCGTTVHIGFFGGTTAATGFNFAANGGLTLGNGAGVVAGGTDTAADNICYISSSTGQVSGALTYVQF